MQVKLRVVGGKNDGREITISGPEFVIGRGEGTHLRPQSDLISRKHCALIIEDGKAFIEDFKSRNGTYLNGERVEGRQQLKVGDRLRVGRLHFEVQIDHAVASSKKPKVEGVKEAAIRTATNRSNGNVDEDSITDWLMEADEPQRPLRRSSFETRQFVLDDTEHTHLKPNADVANGEAGSNKDSSVKSESDTGTDHGPGGAGDKKEKRKPGKLPARPRSESEDSREAATEVLRKFFNRR